MTISQTALDVRQYLKEGNNGDLAFVSHLTDFLTATNESPQAKQSDTVTIDAATVAVVHSVTINGVVASYTAIGGDTTSTIAAGLHAAIQAEPGIGNAVVATVAAAIVTITGMVPGVAYTISASATEQTYASVNTAALADAVGFGLAVVMNGFSPQGDRLAALASEAMFTAQAATITVAGAVPDVVTATIMHGGVLYEASTAWATSDIATAGELAAQLVVSGLTVTDVGDGTITVVADTAGDGFTLTSSEALTGNAEPSAATSLEEAFLGLTIRAYNEEVTEVGGLTAHYPPNAGMRVLRSANGMWLDNAEEPVEGTPVYVDLTVGAGAGKLWASAGAGRVLLPQATWLKAGRTSTDGIAAVQL